MKVLYSDILPLSLDDGKQTILDCFIEQVQKADRIEIATGYHYKLQYLQRLGTLSKVRQVWYNETSIHTRI